MTPIDKIARYGFISVLWLVAFVVALFAFQHGRYTDFAGIVVFLVAGAFSYYSAWSPSGSLDKLARYGFLGSLWLGIALMIMYVSVSISFISLTLIAAVFSAALATIALFPRYVLEDIAHAAAPTEKRKNSPTSARDLLTPDDLYLLRQEIKEELKDELRRQMMRGDTYEDDEPLDALLDDRYTRTKRK